MDEQANDPREQALPGLQVGGPYLQMAVLCEKVLREADGVISVIRVVDRITLSVTGPAPAQMPPAPINLMAVIAFKSGFARGPFTVRMKLVAPSHQELNTVELPILLEGEDRGACLTVQLGFQAEEEGLYWFDVYLLDALVTKVPLRVVYQRMSVSR